jgi:mono/diheme cytochrome c family protein
VAQHLMKKPDPARATARSARRHRCDDIVGTRVIVTVDSLRLRTACGLLVVALLAMTFATGATRASAAPAPVRRVHRIGGAPSTGEEIFRATCAGCHGEGKGAPQTTVAFAVPVPDFTDCKATTPETDADWMAVIRDGGPVRGFSRIMPAFRDLLTPAQIRRVVAYMRTLCPDPAWPRGEFNVALAQVTEKAFPEDEILLTSSVASHGPGLVENHFIIEKRVGARNQLEIDVPFGFRQRPESSWTGGLGDASVTAKHVFLANLASGTIVSGLAGVVLPTGERATGFGEGTTSFEALVLGAQLLPSRSYIQFEGGVSLPTDRSRAPQSAFWSGALGKTFAVGPITRIWSPMIEVAGAHDLVSGAPVDWSVVPQLQVSLSALQHVRASIGVDVPLTQRNARNSQILLYLLWDTFDGPFFSGWKGRCTGCEH